MKVFWIGCWALLVPASAQETTAIEEQITVYSSKAERSLEESVSRVVVVTAAEMERQQWHTVSDVLEHQAGMTVVSNGGDGSLTRVFMRGANSNHVLVLVDGAKRNDGSSVDRAYDFAHLSTSGVERIEIMYGSQSVLYGSDAMAGVINVVTKSGHAAAQGSLFLEGSDAGEHTASMNWQGGSTRVGLSLAADHTYNDSLSIANDSFSTALERDSYERTQARLGAKVQGQRMDASVHLDWLEGQMDLDAFGGDFGDDADFRGRIREWGVSSSVGYKWSSMVRTDWVANVSETDSTTVNPDNFLPQFVDRSRFLGRNSELDLRTLILIGASQRLLVGAEWESEDAEGESLYHFSGEPFVSEFDGNADSLSGYAQLGGELTRGSYLIGARWDDHDQFGSEVTYQLGGSWVIPELKARMSSQFATGFRAPSLYQLYSEYGNGTLDAETSRSWEVGVERGWLDDRLSAELRWHQTTYEHLITFFFDATSFASYFVNEDLAETRGYESSLTYKNQWVTAIVNYEHLNAEDGEGQRLLRRPDEQYGVTINGNWGKRLTGFLRWTHEGKREDITFDPLSFESVRVALDAIDMVDLGASYRVSNRIETQARILNLLDDEAVRVIGYNNHGRRYLLGIKIQL